MVIVRYLKILRSTYKNKYFSFYPSGRTAKKNIEF